MCSVLREHTHTRSAGSSPGVGQALRALCDATPDAKIARTARPGSCRLATRCGRSLPTSHGAYGSREGCATGLRQQPPPIWGPSCAESRARGNGAKEAEARPCHGNHDDLRRPPACNDDKRRNLRKLSAIASDAADVDVNQCHLARERRRRSSHVPRALNDPGVHDVPLCG